MKATKSLSFIVTVWMAVAIAVTMGAYAAYEHSIAPGQNLRVLALGHLGHVLGLSVVVYILCLGVFYFVLLRPLNRIYLHLYAVGAGQIKPLELQSNVREIRTIVDGVNLMLSRLKLGADHDALGRAEHCIAEIREVSRQLAATEQNHFGPVLDKFAADLERTLPSILIHRGLPPPTPVGKAALYKLAVEDDKDSFSCDRSAGES